PPSRSPAARRSRPAQPRRATPCRDACGRIEIETIAEAFHILFPRPVLRERVRERVFTNSNVPDLRAYPLPALSLRTGRGSKFVTSLAAPPPPSLARPRSRRRRLLFRR